MLRIIFTFIFLMVPLCAGEKNSNLTVFQKSFNSISIRSNENSFDINAFIEKNQEYVQSRNEKLQKIYGNDQLVKIFITYLDAKQNVYYLYKELYNCKYCLEGEIDKKKIDGIKSRLNNIEGILKKNKELIVSLKKLIIYKYCEKIEESAIKNLIKMKKGRVEDSENTVSDSSKKRKFTSDQN